MSQYHLDNALLNGEGRERWVSGVGVGRERGEGEHTSRNTLDTATASKTTDGGLGDALDVVSEDLAVALCSAFAEALAAFSAWRGGC